MDLISSESLPSRERRPSPLKILRIITRLNIGGPAIHAALLSTKMDPQRFSTCLVVGTPHVTEGDLSPSVQGPQVRVVRLKTLRRSIRPWADAGSFMRLMRLVWRERPQLIHTHMAKAGTLGRLAGLSYNRLGPGRTSGASAILIHTFHGHVLEGYFPAWLSGIFVCIERWLAKRTDVLIAVSQTIRDELIKKGIGRLEQWRVVPLGLDLSAFAQLPFPNGSSMIRVGMVGRLVPIKNPSLFLQAMARLVRQQPAPSVCGIIVGDGPLRQALEREVRQLGLDGVVQFTGWRPDVRTVYDGLDVTCLTSWNEGTPVSLIEAMAAGRAVVATDVGGVRDLLGDGDGERPPVPHGGFQVVQRGILIRTGDLGGLTAALNVLSRETALRKTLGEAARSYVVREFNHERLLRDLTALYETLCLSGEGQGDRISRRVPSRVE